QWAADQQLNHTHSPGNVDAGCDYVRDATANVFARSSMSCSGASGSPIRSTAGHCSNWRYSYYSHCASGSHRSESNRSWQKR
ncbi:MAG: hypothetical protein AAB288_08300, partial [Acidobacteriota bacterium]